MRSQPSPTRSRSREQRAGTVAQNLGQRIGKTSWMGEPENVSVGHGVSLLQWRSGGVEHPHDTPPYPFMPSPTFAHSSQFTTNPIRNPVTPTVRSSIQETIGSTHVDSL